MNTGISIVRVRIPFKRFKTRGGTPTYFRVFFAHMAPPENTGVAGDFYVEIAPTPKIYVKARGSRRPHRIAWRWVQENNQLIRHPSRPHLCASSATQSLMPTCAHERDYNGNLHLAARKFLDAYGHGGHDNPIDLTLGTRSNPFVIG